MTMLAIYDESGAPLAAHLHAADIAQALAPLNVGLAHYTLPPLPDADDVDVLKVYANTIDTLRQHGTYASIDAVRMQPHTPDAAALRAKFLAEHTHADDEVRLFVKGGGRFCLHHEQRIYALTCVAGDYVSVPAGIRHWFDAGEAPDFAAVRLFTAPNGWVPAFTGHNFSDRVPPYIAVKARVIDIEGTVGSIAFVREVLFPYARSQIADFVQANPQLPLLRDVPGDTLADKTAHLLQMSDADVKFGPLKQLQGMIWRSGYTDGTLRGHLYPDAVADLRARAAAGLPTYVYSSGSIEAQKLLFAHSVAGDLTPCLSGYFDTTIGAKTDPASYRAIAAAIDVPGASIEFFSDNPDELQAARNAGWQAIGVTREGSAFDVSAFVSVARF